MKHTRQSERGQALVLIVVGMIALIGISGLAIDGGNVYSDRRHAQNAADTAALATGLTWIRNPTNWPVAENAGITRAADNGYQTDASGNVVHVYRCDDVDATCSLPSPLPALPDGSPDKLEYYVQVRITSHVQTYFAKILGITQMTNEVQAVARAVPSEPKPWYFGNALVATQTGCHPPAPYDAFTAGGGSKSTITGVGGVFVNSTCSNAFTAQGTSEMSSVDGICVVGGVVNNGTVNPPPTANCAAQVNPNSFQMPSVTLNDSCPDHGIITTVSPGNYVAGPGYYNNTFPNVSPAGTIRLTKGIYCLKNGFSVNSQWNITTDVDGNGTFDGSDGADEGVLLYVINGGFTVNGGATVHLGAMNKIGTDPGIKGYLVYLPPTNSSAVDITGGSNEHFVGTILAPSSLITLNGGAAGDSLDLECQIIGLEIKLTGNGDLSIQYNQGQNAMTFTNPILQLYR